MQGLGRSFSTRWAPLLAILAGLWSVLGCGGAAGIENGTIIGRVFHNIDLASRTAQLGPESNVAVVAQRESGTPLIIRSTLSDSNGVYMFTDLPNGPYVIGFQKEGFLSVTTESGASAQRTAVGSKIRVFVEPGRTSIAPDVTLRAVQETGNFTLIVTVLDRTTGDPVRQATVRVGNIATTDNQSGVYTLVVPIVGTVNDFNAAPSTQLLEIFAEGFVDGLFQVLPLVSQSFRVTLFLDPNVGSFAGTARVNPFPQLTVTGIQVSVQGLVTVGGQNVQGTVGEDGRWQVGPIPVSNPQTTRQFNLVFSHPDLKTFVLQNVVAPRTGTKNLAQTVVLERVTVDVIGTVVDSSGNAPNAEGDTVTVVETGQQVNLVNGTYTIPKVPQQTGTGATGFTLQVRVRNRTTNTQETGSATGVLPRSDGTANPVFVVPTIRTAAT